LNGGQAGLKLPAVEGGAIVGDRELNVAHVQEGLSHARLEPALGQVERKLIDGPRKDSQSLTTGWSPDEIRRDGSPCQRLTRGGDIHRLRDPLRVRK